MKKTLLLIFMTLSSINPMWARDGQTVWGETPEGITVMGTVINGYELSVQLMLHEGVERETITGTVTIPAHVEGWKVTEIKAAAGFPNVTKFIIPSTVMTIADNAFIGCSNAQFDIQSRLEHIGYAAFAECTSIKKLDLKFLKTIGELAFVNCTGLTSINLGEEITSIGQHTFDGCTSLSEITIPSSVKEIGLWAFGRTALTSVNIPESVTSIGDYAFGYTALTALNIPKSVTEIGYGIVAWSPKISSITVNEGNPIYESRSNAIVEKATNKLIQGCKTTIIPESVTEIYAASFTGMGISEFVIPKSITKIGNYIFTFNDDLGKVTSYIEDPYDVNEEAFWYSGGDEPKFTTATLYVPAGTKAKYEAAGGWKNFEKIIEMDGETGIATSVNGEASIDNYYDFNGHKLNKPNKGINIIKMSDGSVKKVIVK